MIDQSRTNTSTFNLVQNMTHDLVSNGMSERISAIKQQLLTLRDAFRQHQSYIRHLYDITETEMEIILYVDKNGAQKMKHIGETFGIKFSTLTSLVDKIEEMGLIKRVNSKEDRRSVLITLTKKGKKLVDEYDQQASHYSDLLAMQPTDSQDLFSQLVAVLMNPSGSTFVAQA